MGKLIGVDQYVFKPAEELEELSTSILLAIGCNKDTARFVSRHLVDANLKGVDSHGVMRLNQYVEQANQNYFSPAGQPTCSQTERGAWLIDGQRGFGMPAMRMAVTTGVELAQVQGMSVVGVQNCGHTGRIGAFCEQGANQSCLTIVCGGGGRHDWRQVTPFGGASPMLPTNPYGFGIPGGDHGPVILDFATSAGAGGWIYAAKSAGGEVPDGMLIDKNGKPTRDPEDYLAGGALLPAAGPKGYGLALIAELLGDAMLGPVELELNWLVLIIDITRYCDIGKFHPSAEAILAELRACPPVSGFDQVEIPGERERTTQRQRQLEGIPIPSQTWLEIQRLKQALGLR